MEWKFLPEDKSGSARKSRDYRLFNERVIKSAQLLEKSLSEYIVREDEDLNTNKLLKETREIIALSDDPVHTFRMLRRVRRYDDLTYIHSLNVAILCHEFANWMHMPEEDIIMLQPGWKLMSLLSSPVSATLRLGRSNGEPLIFSISSASSS